MWPSYLTIDKATVLDDRVEAVVSSDSHLPVVTAEAAERIVEALPGIARHICVNSGHERFGDEVVGTEPAHLMEHVAIELMTLEAVLDDPDSHRTFSGHTSPLSAGTSTDAPLDIDDDGRGPSYLVAVTYADDLVALSALGHAADLVAWAFGDGGPLPDTEQMVRELHVLRGA